RHRHFPDAALTFGETKWIVARCIAGGDVDAHGRRLGRPHAEGGAEGSDSRAAIELPPWPVGVALLADVQSSRIRHAPTSATAPMRRGPPGGISWNQRKSRPLMVSKKGRSLIVGHA